MKHSVQVLNGSWIQTEIVFDGPSLPILEITMADSKKVPIRYLLLNKSQVEQLIQGLQHQLTEM